jgi:hypothetical protein
VTKEEFDYFYIDRLEQCNTYIDLQITVIYIFSLQHGLSSVIQKVFADPLAYCLTPKVFSGLIVTLFTAFCSFEDEVMNQRRLLVYLRDKNSEQFKSTIGALKVGDVLLNQTFLMSSKGDTKANNASSNCLFIEFDDIPMLSDTYIKNYLNVERFSFYKESTEYLIAPYTEFTVKKI